MCFGSGCLVASVDNPSAPFALLLFGLVLLLAAPTDPAAPGSNR